MKILLYFISILHVIFTDLYLRKACGIFLFYYFFLFCSFALALQVTVIFSNFPQLKQLNKIKNTCAEADSEEGAGERPSRLFFAINCFFLQSL